MRYRTLIRLAPKLGKANVDHGFWKDIVVILHSSSSKFPFATHTSQTSLSTYTNTFQTVFTRKGHSELTFQFNNLQNDRISISTERHPCRSRHNLH